jgi:hypothetical protein
MCAVMSACSGYHSRTACGGSEALGAAACPGGSELAYNQYGNLRLSAGNYGMCASINGTSPTCSSAAGDISSVCGGMRSFRLPAATLVQYDRFPDFERPPCGWPEAPLKLIAMLREPGERAQSAYTYALNECVCNFKFPWCTIYTNFRYKNRQPHLCTDHKPKHSFYNAISVLHRHHSSFGAFSVTSTESEHILGRFVAAVVKEVYTPFFGKHSPLGGVAAETSISLPLARITLSHCFAWVGIADELELSLRLLKMEMGSAFGHLDLGHLELQWRPTAPTSRNAEALGLNHSHPYLRSHLLTNDYELYDTERARLYRRAQRQGLYVVPAGLG